MTPMNKSCGRCAFRTQDGVHCGLTNAEINPEVDYCSKCETNPKVCDICGKLIAGNSIIDEGCHLICWNCFNSFGTCGTCNCSHTCSFETDPSPLPKIVNQQIRRGSMVMNGQVRNPQRIAVTCGKGCKCWNGNQCRKEQGNCENYKHTY